MELHIDGDLVCACHSRRLLCDQSGYFAFFPVVVRHNARRSRGDTLAPEVRLKPLLFHVVLLPVGLLICAFVATGPPLHWAGEVVASVLIGIANFAIYYATIDYMIAVYGPYTASATGGNGFMRDFLAGLCSFYTGPMYRDLGVRNSYLVLFWLAVLFCLPGYVLYFKGSAIRARSKFANELALEKEGQEKSSNVMENERVGAHDSKGVQEDENSWAEPLTFLSYSLIPPAAMESILTAPSCRRF
jgi:hypothetical protein